MNSAFLDSALARVVEQVVLVEVEVDVGDEALASCLLVDEPAGPPRPAGRPRTSSAAARAASCGDCPGSAVARPWWCRVLISSEGAPASSWGSRAPDPRPKAGVNNAICFGSWSLSPPSRQKSAHARSGIAVAALKSRRDSSRTAARGSNPRAGTKPREINRICGLTGADSATSRRIVVARRGELPRVAAVSSPSPRSACAEPRVDAKAMCWPSGEKLGASFAPGAAGERLVSRVDQVGDRDLEAAAAARWRRRSGAVRVPGRAVVVLALEGHPPQVAAVGVHHVDLRGAGAARGEGDLAALRAPGRVGVDGRRVGELPRVAAVAVGDEDLDVAVERAGEGDPLAVGREGWA